MRHAPLILAALLTLTPLSSAQSQETAPPAQPPAPAPVPIAEWPQERIIAMGQAIYRQDQAAWVATDAVVAHLGDRAPPSRLAGWIVVDEGNAQRVRFLRDDAGVIKAAFDVVVRNRRAGRVEEPDVAIPESQLAQYRARTTALGNLGRLRCSARPNTVVLDDPDSDNWLVWVLTPIEADNTVPFGGHYRFTLSPDGRRVISRDMLSNSCASVPIASSSGERPAGLFMTHIVSDTPVETHVFLSLQHDLPIFIGAAGKVFEVNGASIREVRR